MAEFLAGVSFCHLRSGFGEDEIIDKNSPMMNNPATRPEINIVQTPCSQFLRCNSHANGSLYLFLRKTLTGERIAAALFCKRLCYVEGHASGCRVRT